MPYTDYGHLVRDRFMLHVLDVFDVWWLWLLTFWSDSWQTGYSCHRERLHQYSLFGIFLFNLQPVVGCILSCDLTAETWEWRGQSWLHTTDQRHIERVSAHWTRHMARPARHLLQWTSENRLPTILLHQCPGAQRIQAVILHLSSPFVLIFVYILSVTTQICMLCALYACISPVILSVVLGTNDLLSDSNVLHVKSSTEQRGDVFPGWISDDNKVQYK